MKHFKKDKTECVKNIDLILSVAEVGVDQVDRGNIRIPFMQISQIQDDVLLTPGNLAALGRTYRALNLNVKLLGKREREMKELVSKIEHQRPMLNSIIHIH